MAGKSILGGVTRREFLRNGVYGAAAVGLRRIPLALSDSRPRPLKMAVIADLHHGLAPDAMSRLQAFGAAIGKRKGLDLAIQMGDFCYSQPDSKECAQFYSNLPLPKLHVLGNHDMDKCDKSTAMKFFGMKGRYGIYDAGNFLIFWLDLNHFRKDGKLFAYANGNYFIDHVTPHCADPAQLEWLGRELRKSKKPVILLSHQPLGFAEPGKPLPPEQIEVLKVITDARRDNPAGAVALCLCGHMHVDRLENYQGIPCYCVNSASYFWWAAMWPYSKPLFSFMEVTEDGYLMVEGRRGEFLKKPPELSNTVVGRSASILDRRVYLGTRMPRTF